MTRSHERYWTLTHHETQSLHRCLDRIDAGVSVFATHRQVPHRQRHLEDIMRWGPGTTQGETQFVMTRPTYLAII